MPRHVSILLALIFSGCSNYGQLTFVTKLPKKLHENSGLVYRSDSTLWVVEDRGNPDEIYQVDLRGNLLKELEVKKAKNVDWEDLANDGQGNIYIADTGDNARKRKNLTIYIVKDPNREAGDNIESERIELKYPDGERHDCEAMFFREGHLYLITKHRDRPFTGEAFIFSVPAEKGDYVARRVGSFQPCTEKGRCEVTSADISPDGKKIVLLGYGPLWVFTDFSGPDFTEGNVRTIDLRATTQLESVCFMNDSLLFISDEERGNGGRNLYSFSLPENSGSN